MPKCHICRCDDSPLYRIDQYLICDVCLMQGRLEELAAFALADKYESEAVQSVTVSSWWNRPVPAVSLPQNDPEILAPNL
jgi:hypothetical protein